MKDGKALSDVRMYKRVKKVAATKEKEEKELKREKISFSISKRAFFHLKFSERAAATLT
jgi:hypothetical protein